LLSIEIGFRRSGVQLGLLNFLGKAGGCRSRVASFRLFEFTLALLRRGGEVCVLQYRKELAFFHAASALNEKLFNCGGNFRRENGLLQRNTTPSAVTICSTGPFCAGST